jgi:hypothetical protein
MDSISFLVHRKYLANALILIKGQFCCTPLKPLLMSRVLLGDATDILWVGPRDTAKHPTIHSTAPTTKGMIWPKMWTVQCWKPWANIRSRQRPGLWWKRDRAPGAIEVLTALTRPQEEGPGTDMPPSVFHKAEPRVYQPDAKCPHMWLWLLRCSTSGPKGLLQCCSLYL